MCVCVCNTPGPNLCVRDFKSCVSIMLLQLHVLVKVMNFTDSFVVFLSHFSFKLWRALFVLVRVLTVVIAILTLW